MANAKFEYKPTEDSRIVLPTHQPGDVLTAENNEQAEYYRSLDCLEEVKARSSAKKSSSKDSDTAASDKD